MINAFFLSYFIGLLLYDGAPNSVLGLLELKMLSPYLRANCIGRIDPLRAEIADRTLWKHGPGSLSNDSRRIVGSIMISARLNDGTILPIRHIVIEGRSQQLIGRNAATEVTSFAPMATS